MELRDSTAVVTGGASGLGRATALKLAAMGAYVLVGDRNVAAGEGVADRLGERGEFVETDVTDSISVEALVSHAASKGALRVAVSCAGIGSVARTVDRHGSPHDSGLFARVMGVNLVGTFHLLSLAGAAMAKTDALPGAGRGVIVQTASIAGMEGQVGQLAYAASKGGVIAMTLPAARDLRPAGVRVMTIAPGLFDTPLLASLPEKARTSLAESVVHPARLGDPDEFAALVACIVQNDYINGETIRLDGALRLAPK